MGLERRCADRQNESFETRSVRKIIHEFYAKGPPWRPYLKKKLRHDLKNGDYLMPSHLKKAFELGSRPKKVLREFETSREFPIARISLR